MTDAEADTLLRAVLDLAVTVRDETGPAVTDAARAVLAAAAGDPVAALVTAAALVRVDAPVDAWWQRPGLPVPVDLDALYRQSRTAPRPIPACGTRSAFARHHRLGETVDPACVLAERIYQRNRYRPRGRVSGAAA